MRFVDTNLVGHVQFATDGGPLVDPHAEELVDIVPSTGVYRPDDECAMVCLGVSAWMRTSTGWGMPGELHNIAQALGMTVTRARQLAALLVQAAEQANQINDSPAQAKENT